MFDLIIIPALLGLCAGIAINAGIGRSVDKQMEKEKPKREAFFEALDRKHRYSCEGGNLDKDIYYFIRQVEQERGIPHDTRNNNRHDGLAKLGLYRSDSGRNNTAGNITLQK